MKKWSLLGPNSSSLCGARLPARATRAGAGFLAEVDAIASVAPPSRLAGTERALRTTVRCTPQSPLAASVADGRGPAVGGALGLPDSGAVDLHLGRSPLPPDSEASLGNSSARACSLRPTLPLLPASCPVRHLLQIAACGTAFVAVRIPWRASAASSADIPEAASSEELPRSAASDLGSPAKRLPRIIFGAAHRLSPRPHTGLLLPLVEHHVAPRLLWVHECQHGTRTPNLG